MIRIIEKYKRIPLPIKASIWFVLANVLQNGISFITVPIFTRLLTTEDYGTVSVYQSWLSILTIFATLSLWGGVFNNGMIKYEKNRDEFLSSMQGLATTITIGLLIIYLLFSNTMTNIIDLPVSIVALMFLQINFTTALNLWSSKKKYEFEYKRLVFITVIISIANPIIGLILIIQLKNGGIARILSIALVQIIIGIIVYVNNIIKGKKYYSVQYWKYAVTFNLPLIPHYLSQTILNQSDRIMINNIVGTDKTGIYSVAYSVGMILLIFVISINNTFTPWAYRKIKEKNYKKLEKASYILLILLATGILLLISIAPEIISLMAPPQYSEAIWVVPPISLSIYFIFLYGLFANIEFYFEENKFIMFASVATAALNIVLNLLLIPIFGYMAAGYTTLFSYIIYSSLHFLFMRKIIKKNGIDSSIYDFKKIIYITLILNVLALFITVSYKITYVRYSIITILVILVLINKEKVIESFKMIRE